MNPTQPTLDGLESPQNPGQNGPVWGHGVMETETRAAIAEIEAETPLTGAKRFIKQLAISVAASIDAGNRKGRAVANEAEKLMVIMQQLAPVADDETADDSQFTPETRRLLDALAAPAQFDEAPVRDGEGL